MTTHVQHARILNNSEEIRVHWSIVQISLPRVNEKKSEWEELIARAMF